MTSQGRTITVGLIILIFQLLLLTNASLFFENVEATQTIMIIYSIMLLFVVVAQLATPGREQTESIFTLGPGKFLAFFYGFILTGVIILVLAIPGILASVGEPLILQGTSIALLAGVIFAFNKAYIEEALFRDLLMNRIGNLGQAALFGIFHFAVLSAGGASIGAVLIGAFFLAFLGYIWGYMKNYGGILFITGSHFAWNLKSLGINLLQKFLGG